MIRSFTAITIVLAATTGCSGKILNYTNAADGCKEGVCSGIHYYRLKPSQSYFYQDRILDGEGKIIRFAGGVDGEACVPLITSETKMVPESNPSLITYDAGALEDSKFSVELGDQGNLKSVGVEATSATKAAIEAVSTIANVAKVLKADAGILKGNVPASPVWISPADQPVPPAPYCTSGNIAIPNPSPNPPPPVAPPAKPAPVKDADGCWMGPTGKVCDR